MGGVDLFTAILNQKIFFSFFENSINKTSLATTAENRLFYAIASLVIKKCSVSCQIEPVLILLDL